MPEGLSWEQLTAITKTLLQNGACRSWSLGVYNPDLDPDGHDARRIVRYLAEVSDARLALLGRRPRR